MPKKSKIDKQKEVEEFFKDGEEEIKLKEELAKIKNEKDSKTGEENQKKENIEKMLQTITNTKKIPKDILGKIYSNIFMNLIIAIAIMTYLFLIILGYFNIEKQIYETDLKVFTGVLFVLTILFIEMSYKKQDIKLTIHSIECLALSICSLFLLYFYTIFFSKYHLIVGLVSILFGIYYVVKSIIILLIMRNNYFKTMSDINQILSKDYDKEDCKCQEV